ncbi:MAG TPA: transglutaminase family protein [Terriglobia bacterium]|nr:transglutaminase family protein [Terriglobia bacterium]
MLFHVTHTTRYIYETAVSHGLNEVRLTPRRFSGQQVRDTAIHVHPQPAFMYQRKDYYGNDVTSFEVLEKHDRLEATAESTVDVQSESTGPLPSISWEKAREQIAAEPDPACIEASEFIYNSPYVPAASQLDDYARKTFIPDRPLLECAQDLAHRIHKEFKYRPKSTSIDIPLTDVLRKRQGVCQDFAHVMIGALRSMRLAARYVSGYVRPGPKVQGAQASHAWVGVFFPGNGWCGFDPTNDVMVSDSHITLAWGRDYGDVAPVKGITLGGGGQTIEVEVYVRPLDV